MRFEKHCSRSEREALVNWINEHTRTFRKQFGHSPIASRVPTIRFPVEDFASAWQTVVASHRVEKRRIASLRRIS